MCEIYVKADPILYESRSRSLRIHGCVTKIRLENLFWDILAELAAGEAMTTNQLIAKLHGEIVEYRGEVENFASFLRVTCLRYLSLRQGGERPRLAVIEPGARLSA